MKTMIRLRKVFVWCSLFGLKYLMMNILTTKQEPEVIFITTEAPCGIQAKICQTVTVPPVQD